MKATVIVPCYNEAERLDRKAFLEFVSKTPRVNFVFVDDGSTDETGRRIREMSESLPERISALSLEKNLGKAEAIRHGFMEALRGGPDVVGYWDADLATPLEAVPLLLEVLQRDSRVDIVFGARVGLCGWDIRRSLKRHYFGRFFVTLADTVLGLLIYDTQCGAKLFRVDESLRESMGSPFSHRWLVDLEIVLRLRDQHARRGLPGLEQSLREVPLPHWSDRPDSKIGMRGYIGSFFGLFRLWARYGKTHPTSPTEPRKSA